MPGDVSSESSWLSFTPAVHPIKTSQLTVQTKTLNNAANHSSISTDQNVTMPVLSSNYACPVVKLRLSCHQTMPVLSLPLPVLSPSKLVLTPDYVCLVTTHACIVTRLCLSRCHPFLSCHQTMPVLSSNYACLVTTHACLVIKLCLSSHQTMPVLSPNYACIITKIMPVFPPVHTLF